MKNLKPIIFLVIAIFSNACNSHKKETTTNQTKTALVEESALQIGEYVTGVYEDSKGNLWFGTIQYGIAKYDGSSLKYYTTEDGLPEDRAIGILEDSEGIYWIATGSGLVKYDGENFTTMPVNDDFSSNSISSLFIDSKGIFWVGTWGGVYTFDGNEFTPFSLPDPEIETKINEDTKNWITEIEEDSEGNIWFARDGYGAYKYNGESFTHILKKDGLHSNNVTEIEFDSEGNVWFGTRVAEKDDPDPNKRIGKGGINKMSNNTILSFPEIEAFNNEDVYEIHKDRDGMIWISTRSDGVYKYDGEQFTKYEVPVSVVDMTNDQKGNLWLAGAGGLYRINIDGEVVNVTQDGPWD